MSSTSNSVPSHAAGAPLVSLEIAGMSCGHCVAAVRSALERVPGVRGAQVAVGSARVAINPAEPADEISRAVIAAVGDAGYDARLAAAETDAPAPTPSGGLPVMGSCCSPRQA